MRVSEVIPGGTMFDRLLRIGTICLLVPGTICAFISVIVGPSWFLPTSETLVLLGISGTLALHQRDARDLRQAPS